MIDFSKPRPHSELPLENLKDLEVLCKMGGKGNMAEIGVFRGGSAWVFHECLAEGQRLFLFDTFTGIPHESDIDVVKRGRFADVSLDDVKAALPRAEFRVGIFPYTLSADVSDLSFVHVDCDQYEGCSSAIKELWPRMRPGGIIAFDDYPFPGIQKAIHENLKEVRFSKHKIPFAVKPWGEK